MDPIALALVVASSVLHVGWNALAKGARDPLAFLWLAKLLPALVGAALLVRAGLAGAVDSVALTCIAASGAVHGVYFWALGAAYELSDLSFVYPYSRAAGALLSVTASLILFSDPVTALGAAGLSVTLLAMLVEALPGRTPARPASRWRGAALTALTGVAIAGYQLIDKIGVDNLDPLSYLGGLLCASFLALTPALWRRGRLRAELGRSGARPLAASLFLASSYGLVLWAMTLAPLSYVVAARASGVAISALAGLLLFREPVTRTRWLAVAMVTIGVYCIGAS